MGQRRILPIRRKSRHLDWIMAFVVRTHNCAICARPLVEGYNARDPGKCLTLHHTQGNREVDRWDDLEYVSKMVLAHKTCHRSYHLTKTHKAAGRKIDEALLAERENNIADALKKQEL